MIPIVSAEHVKKIDNQYVISNGISSWDLMESAASAFCDWVENQFSSRINVFIFCGPGNNGADGFAIGRILRNKGYKVTIICLSKISSSKDWQRNFDLLPSEIKIQHDLDLDLNIQSSDLVIDALFGVGLNRPIDGEILKVVHYLNTLQAIKLAVDIPSGLFSDGLTFSEVLSVDYTLTFQFPKLALLLPENARFIGKLVLLDVGISEDYFLPYTTNKYFLQRKDILGRHPKFHAFAHKGDFGKVLLIGGSKGKMGALILSAKAALRSGSGLLTCACLEDQGFIAQIALPEAMLTENKISLIPNLSNFDAIGVGIGWGDKSSKADLLYLLKNYHKPMVIDADGLNVLAAHQDLLPYLIPNSILTPHIKEFDRLVGGSSNQLERIEKAKKFAMQYQIILVLKGAFTLINFPDGEQVFNSTGTQFMATAGSGDVLTGIITSFLGQKYSPKDAAICAVYHHGLAGELCGLEKGKGTIASDLIEKIPASLLSIPV